MMRAILAAAALALASGATLAEGDRVPPGGIEAGQANGAAAGRTDKGSQGATPGEEHERARGKANSQARGPNPKGSFLRPADSPAQMNRRPKIMGSGAPSIQVAEQPPVHGRNYRRANHRGRAGGIASGKGNSSGASTDGSAGKSADAQPPDHDGEAGKSSEPAR